MMSKDELRRQFLRQRKALTPDDVNRGSQRIAERFFGFLENSSLVHHPATIHLFLPIQRLNEVDTWLIIRKIWTEYKHLTVAVPVTNTSDDTLTHYRLFPETLLVENRWGILEPVSTAQQLQPTDFDLVLVPLLVFDRQGQRIGYGGGFYDRFLAECRLDCFKVGLSFVEPVDQIDSIEITDVPVDICLTPEQIYYFK